MLALFSHVKTIFIARFFPFSIFLLNMNFVSKNESSKDLFFYNTFASMKYDCSEYYANNGNTTIADCLTDSSRILATVG